MYLQSVSNRESNMPLLVAPRVDSSLCLLIFLFRARDVPCFLSQDDNTSRSGQSQEPKNLVDAHAICPIAPIVSFLQIFVDWSRARSFTRWPEEAKGQEPRAAAIANSSCADETGVKMRRASLSDGSHPLAWQCAVTNVPTAHVDAPNILQRPRHADFPVTPGDSSLLNSFVLSLNLERYIYTLWTSTSRSILLLVPLPLNDQHDQTSPFNQESRSNSAAVGL
jgi:hypothetical protein